MGVPEVSKDSEVSVHHGRNLEEENLEPEVSRLYNSEFKHKKHKQNSMEFEKNPCTIE